MPIDSPRINTSAWSATVMGLVRKKKPSMTWKRQREVRIVLADMSAMVDGGCCRGTEGLVARDVQGGRGSRTKL